MEKRKQAGESICVEQQQRSSMTEYYDLQIELVVREPLSALTSRCTL
jgi:hypothetical protein